MKAAVIGCGRMGLRHVQALTELQHEIVGVTDINQQAVQNACQRFNLNESVLFQDSETLFKQACPELVVIATTAPSHFQYIGQCINHGVSYILCEKPLATSIADCEAIIRLSERSNIKIAVNHQMRFLDQYTKPKSLTNSKFFGGLSSINVTAGNFGMAMNGTHYFEMARFMFDEYPKRVCAWFNQDVLPNPRGEQFKDKAGSVRIEMDSGKRFYLDADAGNGHGLLVNYCCRYGQIAVDELAGQIYYTRRKEEFLDLPTTRYGQPSEIATDNICAIDVVASTKAVMNALVTDADYPTAYDAMHAIKTLVAAYVSNENGHVEVDIDNDHLPKDREFPWA